MISLCPGRRLQPVGGDDASDPPVDQPPAPLVTVANRLPVVKTRTGWRTADGGLVAALRPTFEQRPGTWVGWDGGSPGVPHTLSDLAVRLVPVSLRKAEVEGYYHGFSNRTLWPLFHGLADRVVIDRRWWHQYTARERELRGARARGDADRIAPLDPRLPAPRRARSSCDGQARRSRSASSCTSRSRRPSCSPGCPGGEHLVDGHARRRRDRLPDRGVPRELRAHLPAPEGRRDRRRPPAAAPERARRC